MVGQEGLGDLHRLPELAVEPRAHQPTGKTEDLTGVPPPKGGSSATFPRIRHRSYHEICMFI